MNTQEQVSRKEFIKSFFKILRGGADADDAAEHGTQKPPAYVLPPGARKEEHFLDNCNHCYACVAACMHEAIAVYRRDEHHALYGYPYIDPRIQPCLKNDNFPCIEACPTPALDWAYRDFSERYAVIDTDICFAYRDLFCMTCVQHCPPQEQAINLDSQGRPSVNEDNCSGCGICILYCPSEPPAITIHASKD